MYSRDRRTNFGAPLTLNPVGAEAGYTGHIEDPEQGLVYMQQRYYDPAIARFLSVDPVGPLADPTNHFGRYHYAYNNPYRYTDPDGRAPGSRISCGGESKGPCDREGQSRAPADFRGGGSEADEIRATRAGIFTRAGETYVEAGKEAGKEGLLMASGGLLAGTLKATRGVASLPTKPGQLGHIFRNAPGHLADTPANRKLLTDVASNAANRVGVDRFGNVWSSVTRADGTQVWVSTRNGVIQNGGLNQVPQAFPNIVGP